MRRTVRSLLGPVAVRDIVYLPGGYTNDNFAFTTDAGRFVVRIPRAPEPSPAEADFYGSTSRPMHAGVVAADFQVGTLITHWQPGPLLVDVEVTSLDVVRYAVGLHRAMPDTARLYPVVDQIRSWLSSSDAPAWANALLERVVAWYEEADVPLVARHNDLNPWNVIAANPQPAGWITLDWAWFGRNVRLFDLACAHQGLGFPPAGFARVAVRYAAALGDAPPRSTEVRRTLQLFWLREYAFALAAWSSGNRRPEIAEQLWWSAARLAEINATRRGRRPSHG